MVTILAQIDSCSICTKIILLLCAFGILIVLDGIFKRILSFMGNSFDLKKIINGITHIFKIIGEYELKTIAGAINFITTLILGLTTLSVFLSSSINSIIGIKENITISKIIFVILTIVASFVSIWLLYKFDKIKNMMR